MLPVIVFDLDDTLYEELSYVRSGFAAVAEHGWREYSLHPSESLETMLRLERTVGRGSVFNDWLAMHGLLSGQSVRKCISVYRAHEPSIVLDPDATKILAELVHYKKYVVTDGNKNVQARKVQALGIWDELDGTYITHRYGVKNAKPSLFCFDIIRRREFCEWKHMVYVGDNPAKDFVGLNCVGGNTIRILRGPYRGVLAAPGFDGQVSIKRLTELPGILENLQSRIERGNVAAHSDLSES